jgi:hypothetical protein
MHATMDKWHKNMPFNGSACILKQLYVHTQKADRTAIETQRSLHPNKFSGKWILLRVVVKQFWQRLLKTSLILHIIYLHL